MKVPGLHALRNLIFIIFFHSYSAKLLLKKISADMFVGIVKENTFAIFPRKIIKPFQKFSCFQ